MKINGVEFNASLNDILMEIDAQLATQGLQKFDKIKDIGNDINKAYMQGAFCQ